MEPLARTPFTIAPATAVVTTKYVVFGHKPILLVAHELDEQEGAIWQFHCGNNDYRGEVLLLVRLDEILKVDPSLYELANLPPGFSAVRMFINGPWKILPIEEVSTAL